MDNKIKGVIKIFECRHCASTNKLSAIKENFYDAAVVEIRCLECREKETIII